MYGFKYFRKGKIFELCKNVENVKGLTIFIGLLVRGRIHKVLIWNK